MVARSVLEALPKGSPVVVEGQPGLLQGPNPKIAGHFWVEFQGTGLWSYSPSSIQLPAPRKSRPPAQDIPVEAARDIAVRYGYDQVLVIARRTGEGGREHVTTFGLGEDHSRVAAKMGDFIKFRIMQWPEQPPSEPAPKKPSARSSADMDEHLTMVEDCEARESRLTDWERGFVDNIKKRLCAGQPLTDGQAESLDKVWTRLTAKGARL